VLVAIGVIVIQLSTPMKIHQIALIYLVLGVPIAVIRYPILGLLRGWNMFAAYNLCRIMWVFPYLILVLICLPLGRQSVDFVVFANLFGLILSFLLGAVIVLTRVRPRLPTKHLAGMSLKYGLVVHLGTIASSDTLRIDLMMIALLLAPRDVGIYTAASTVMVLPRLIGLSIGSVSLTEQAASTQSLGRELAARRFRQCVVVTGALIVCISAVSHHLMVFAFGHEFRDAGRTAAILVIGGGLVSVRRVLADCLRAAGHQLTSTMSEVGNLLLSAVLLFPAVKLWGLEGAAIAFTTAHLVSFVLLVPVTIDRIGVSAASLVPGRQDVVPFLRFVRFVPVNRPS
jgi:O-antigen/teichoic acid export membrane protein